MISDNIRLEHILTFLGIKEEDLPVVGTSIYNCKPQFDMIGRSYFIIEKTSQNSRGWRCIGFHRSEVANYLKDIKKVNFYDGETMVPQEIGTLTYVTPTTEEQTLIENILNQN